MPTIGRPSFCLDIIFGINECELLFRNFEPFIVRVAYYPEKRVPCSRNFAVGAFVWVGSIPGYDSHSTLYCRVEHAERNDFALNAQKRSHLRQDGDLSAGSTLLSDLQFVLHAASFTSHARKTAVFCDHFPNRTRPDPNSTAINKLTKSMPCRPHPSPLSTYHSIPSSISLVYIACLVS